jgi:hypothetical protein
MILNIIQRKLSWPCKKSKNKNNLKRKIKNKNNRQFQVPYQEKLINGLDS